MALAPTELGATYDVSLEGGSGDNASPAAALGNLSTGLDNVGNLNDGRLLGERWLGVWFGEDWGIWQFDVWMTSRLNTSIFYTSYPIHCGSAMVRLRAGARAGARDGG